MKKGLTKSKNRIEMVLIGYWLVLVVWQNISSTTARTSVDVLIKAGLIVFFVVYFASKSNFQLGKILPITLITMILLLCFFLNGNFNLNSILAYLYPILTITCIYGLGDEFVINKNQLIWLLNGIILIVLYMVLYAIIFCSDQFTNAFRLSTAYGNELKSFLFSNYEYGLYLAIATTSAIICFELKHNLPLRKRWQYIVVIPIFMSNLILTFSRTSIIAMLLILLIYCFFGQRSGLKKLIIFGLTAFILAIFIIPTLREFFIEIVFKGNNFSGRDELSSIALEKFLDANWIQKLFGYGDSNIRKIFGDELGHASVHNAYLQILLSYGAIPLFMLIVFLTYSVIYCVKLCKYNRFLGVILASMVGFAMVVMTTTTSILFTSPIDSFFLTMFVAIIPKYVGNAVKKGDFL